jgi:hypothetical protein
MEEIIDSGGYGYQLKQTPFIPGSTPQIYLNQTLGDLFSASGFNTEQLELTKEQSDIVYSKPPPGGGVGGGSQPIPNNQACTLQRTLTRKSLYKFLSIDRQLNELQTSYHYCLGGCGTLSCPKCADCEYPCVALCLKGPQDFLCTELAGVSCLQCETYKNNPNHPSVLAWQEFCFMPPGSVPRSCGSINLDCQQNCESQYKSKIDDLIKEREKALIELKKWQAAFVLCASGSAGSSSS